MSVPFSVPTQTTTPAGRVTYTAYDDVDHATRTYAGWGSVGNGNYGPTGPVQVQWGDWADGFTVTAAYAYTPTTAAFPTGTDAIANLTALTLEQLDDGGQVTAQYAYHDLSGVAINPADRTDDAGGTAGVNYYTTAYGYDAGGWLYQTTDADGTITQTTHNALGWTTEQQLGTSAGMTDVADEQYNADGELTTETLHPGAGQPDRTTAYTYDGRDRLVQTVAGSGAAGAIVTVDAYDNANDLTGTQQYAAAYLTGGTTDLRAETATAYDDQGRPYRQTATSVNQTTGATGAADATNAYYDRRGLTLATVGPTGLATQYAYDGAGRVSHDYTGTLSAATWAAAGTPSGSVVLHQDNFTYDGDGNVIETVGLDRYSDTPAGDAGTLAFEASGGGLTPEGFGPAGDDGVSVMIGARPTITDAYYDAADRVTATVDAGTDGYSSWSRPATPPARGDGPLVTSYGYNAAGQVSAVTDPLGLVTATSYDALGRTTRTVADYTGTFAADGTPAGATPADGSNQTTAYTYDGDGHVTSMTAVMPAGEFSQTTDYVYGATTAAGSGVNDDDLLAQTQYPDPATGAAESGTGWTFTGAAGVIDTAAAATAGQGVPAAAPDGSRVGFVQGTGSLAQTLGLNGGTYTLSFDAAQRAGYGSQSVAIEVDGTTVATLTPAQGNAYTAESVTFTVPAGMHAITFAGVDPDNGNHMVLIDSVALAAATPGGVAPEVNDGGFEAAVPLTGPYAGIGFGYYEPAGTTGQSETDTYDAAGDTLTATDRDGTTHDYGYDAQSRLTGDKVATFGAGVDQAVGSLGYTYNDAGLLLAATSYATVNGAGPAPIVNQDLDTYDGFGQLATEEQAVSGGASASSPTVGYTYDTANGDRLSGITYPNGRTLSYNYNANALTSAASQITSLSDATGTLQSYTYLGLDTPVTFADGNGVTLSYLAGDGSASDGGDAYTGLDRFGRVVDQDWVDGSGTAVDEQQYTYDADGNVRSRDDTVTPGQSELYTYDGLNRLATFARGTLNGTDTGMTTTTETESWSLDAVGNWHSNTVNGTTSSRTNSAQNQVLTVGSATLAYDADGNTLTDNTGQQYVYDAWNRLVAVKNSGGTTVAAYTYDAQNRRVTETEGGTTTALYYSKGWQVLEARQGGVAVQQYTWSPFYVDGLVARDDHTPGEGGTSLDRRLYAEQDADYNVTSLTDATGTVVERYAYDPYGAVTVENPDGSTRGTGAASNTAYQSVYLYEGLRLDVVSGLEVVRSRNYSLGLNRFVQQDFGLSRFRDGLNQYQFTRSNPIDSVDPNGHNLLIVLRNALFGGASGSVAGAAVTSGVYVGGAILFAIVFAVAIPVEVPVLLGVAAAGAATGLLGGLANAGGEEINRENFSGPPGTGIPGTPGTVGDAIWDGVKGGAVVTVGSYAF